MDELNELEKNSTPIQPQSEIIPDIEIPTLRTYKSDINNTVNKDKITTAKILMAEQRRTDIVKEKAADVSVKKPLNFLATVFGLVFLVAAIGIIIYFGYTKVVQKTFAPITVPASFLFIFDNEKLIDASKDKTEIYSEVDVGLQKIAEMEDGTYTEIVLFKTDPKTKARDRISSFEFFDIYNVQLPTNISRSISGDFVYGAYRTEGKTEPFLVVGLVDFENAYDSMFVWENTLALDIKDVFPVLKNLFDISKRNETPAVPTILTSATSSASTTKAGATSTTPTPVASTSTQPELTPEEKFEQQNEMRQVINRTIRFVDIVLYNRDVRGVRDSNGNPFFYYTFINREKILFAQDPVIVNEINRKIKEKQLVR